jgi:uncharacterized protein (UPF0179 family)
MGIILHPVSYTADDIFVHHGKTTGFSGLRSWKSCDDIHKNVLRDYEITDLTDTSPDAKLPEGLVRELIVHETTPITVIPFEEVTTKSNYTFQIEECEKSCDKSIERSPISERKSVSVPFVDHRLVVEYLCSAKMSSEKDNPENDQSPDNLLLMKDKIGIEVRRGTTQSQ